MKLWVKCFLCFCLCVFSLSICASHSFSARKAIKFGYLQGFGFSARSFDKASARGYMHTLLSRMETFSARPFTFVPYVNATELLGALKTGEVDVGLALAKLPEREAEFLYGRDAMGIAQRMLVAKGQDYGFYEDPSQIDGKVVATYHNSIMNKTLDDYCRKHGYKVNYVYDTFTEYHALEADYYLISSLSEAFRNFNSVIPLSHEKYYLLFRKKDVELEEYLHNIYQDTVAADSALLPRLHLKYYRSNITRRDLTQHEEALLKGKTFTVGYAENHQPVHYTNRANKQQSTVKSDTHDGANGVPDGVVVQLMKVLAERYGFKVTFVPYSLEDKSSVHENFDFLLSLLGTYVRKRNFYRGTEAYANHPFMLYTSTANMHIEDFPQKKISIGILQYLAVDTLDILQEYPNAHVSVYTSLPSLLDDFESGYLDAFFYPSTGMTYLAHAVQEDLFAFATRLNLPFKLFISRKLNPDYVNIFNVLFDYISPEEFDEIGLQETLQFVKARTITDVLTAHRYEVLAVLALLIMLYFFTIYLLQNKRKMAVLSALKQDNLTGLMSYAFFERETTKRLTAPDCAEHVLISIDVDSFNLIALHYCHEVADEFLCSLASMLNNHLKADDGLITRTFADNFLLFTKYISAGEVESRVHERIIPPLREFVGADYPLTLSVGILPIKDCHTLLSTQVDKANLTRLKGKNIYKTTVCMFDDHLRDFYSNRLDIVYKMENALKNNEFFLVFQPKIDLHTLKIKGAEALVRWKDSRKNIIYPSTFIPVFEENGFIHTLDLYVFRKVCEFLHNNPTFPKNQVISVNISNKTMQDVSIVGLLKMIVDEYKTAPQMIELEITESAMCSDFAHSKIDDFKSMGFSVSIDDFGAGVSSLNRLGSMHADVLKLDKTFLDVSDENFRAKVVVQDTILMAKHLQMRVVAEGVESLSQVHWLRKLHCDMAQGYYFFKPLPVEDFLTCIADDATYNLPPAA